MMDISYDKFIRTTDDYHVKAVQKILKNYMIKGIYIKAHMRVHIVHHVNHFGLKLN